VSVWPIIVILLVCAALALPTARRVWREAREQDIIKREALAEKVRNELMGEYTTETFQAVWDDSELPPYRYWPEAETETS
jgi:hypothetical protein